MSRLNLRSGMVPLAIVVSACCQRATGGESSATTVSAVSASRQGHYGNDCSNQVERSDPSERRLAARRVHWRCDKKPTHQAPIAIKVLGFNDFHGHLAESSKVGDRPVGGAAVLSAYFRAAMRGREDAVLLIHAGDHVGASPPESALLQDEPSIQFLNTFANAACKRTRGRDPQCNVVGTLGNHEFDEGKDELLRLLNGGNYKTGPFLQNPYPGATFDYVNANVFVEDTANNLVDPYVVREVAGVRVGVIGAVLKETPSIVTPSGVAGLSFRDEADSINIQVKKLRANNIETIIVTMHQGAAQSPAYDGPTDPESKVGSPIAGIVARLDDAVDLVISGHSHTFTNALVRNSSGHEILVTQAFSFGTAYDDIDLEIDRSSGDVISKSASIVTTYSDVAPGNARDPSVQAIVDAAVRAVAPRVNQVIATISSDITRAQTSGGESALGDLVADSQRAALRTDFAFTNPGGIRADLTYAATASNPADANGKVLWGELFTVQPFTNSLVKLWLTGQQIINVLNQQWQVSKTRMLQVSGLTYTWDNAKPAGNRIVEVKKAGVPVDLATLYSVAVSSFLAAGGDGFTVFASGKGQMGGDMDLDALIEYLSAAPQPVTAPTLNRITRRN